MFNFHDKKLHETPLIATLTFPTAAQYENFLEKQKSFCVIFMT